MSLSPDSSTIPGSEHDSVKIVNLAAYKFVALDQLEERREELRELCRRQGLRGTILLAPEGINLFVAGSEEATEALLNRLSNDPQLPDLEIKRSYSDHQPFRRMLVKIKQEIIAFGVEGIDPVHETSRRIDPHQLRDWLAEGQDVTLLDVRNNYEVRVGTFENAVPIDIDHFRDFPDAARKLPDELRHRPVVMFCTGGIRCEKAGPLLEQLGFEQVYQLHGGILKYFEDVGGDFYNGECFVFDQRVALDPALKETETRQCYACLTPLTVEDQTSPHYDPPHACPHCYQTPEQRDQKKMAARHAAIQRITTPLPGSTPYDNVRPLNIPQRFDGRTMIEFLDEVLPQQGHEFWTRVIDLGRIRQNGQPVPADRIVRAGEQFAHLEPATVEPDVSAAIRILHEDDAIVVVNKPAPLPSHPSGRFHRNTLSWILNDVYRPATLRPAHRLDANTTGVMIFSRSRQVSSRLHPQFESGSVRKTYLVRVLGQPTEASFRSDMPISKQKSEHGGRLPDPDGQPAATEFDVLRLFEDGTTLLRATPATGRTNQIRIHLWDLGLPVLGDPLYRAGGQLGSEQTLRPGEVMCLHARTIEFEHPVSGERATFESPDPEWVVHEDWSPTGTF